MRRTIVVAVAVVVGVVAGGLVYYYLHHAQENAFKNAKLVPAYVVAKNVPRGLGGATAVSGGYFKLERIPAENRPTTAVTNLDAIQNMVASAPFSVNQVLVNGMFLSASQASLSFSDTIPRGDVAISVSVDQVHGVANLVSPGDHVDILVQVNNVESYMLQNVPVLAIGQEVQSQTSATPTTAATTASSTDTSGLITFAVHPFDAERIALAQQSNLGIYLALVPPNNPVANVGPAIAAHGAIVRH
jgi:pilus assembly protein CpaB